MRSEELREPGSRVKLGFKVGLKKLLSIVGILALGVVGIWLYNYISYTNRGVAKYPGQTYEHSELRPGCGNQAAQWATTNASIVCLPGQMLLSTTQPPQPASAVFVDNEQSFPANYQVTVTISDLAAGACAGPLLRGNQAQASGYAFFVCSNGQWDIVRYEPDDPHPSTITGSLPTTTQGAYTLKVTAQGKRYQLFINSISVQIFEDSLLLNTQNINLMVGPSGSAAFADFAIEELA